MGKVRYRNQIALILSLVGACAFLFAGAASAVNGGEAEAFERAFGLYLDYQPDKAAALFRTFLREFPESSAKDAALFWQAKSLIQEGKTKEARQVLLRVRDEFPESLFKGFALKELEAPERPGSEVKAELNQGKGKRKEVRNERSKRCEEALRKSEEKRRDLEGRIPEISKKNKILANDLSKALEEKGSAEALLKEERKKIEISPDCKAVMEERDKFANEMKSLAARLRESDEKSSGLVTEKDAAAGIVRAATKERDDAIAALKEIEARFPDASEMAMRLREREKFQKDQDEYIKKLKEDVRALSDGIKLRDKKLSEADKTIASMQGRGGETSQTDKGETKKAEGELRKTGRETEELARLKRAVEEKGQEIEGLKARLQDKEKIYSDADALVKKISAENAQYEARLKEKEGAIAEFARLKEEYEKLKAEKFQPTAAAIMPAAGESPEMLKNKYGELKEAYDALIKRNTEMEADSASLRARVMRYESPLVKIGEESYSRYQIMEENLVSLKVLSKIGAAPAWRSGDAYEDFIIEGVLSRMASGEDRKKMRNAAGPMVKKHAFDSAEAAYLTKYLVVDELIKRKKSPGVVDEQAIKNFYEANKKDYQQGAGERYVKYLVMKFTKTDKARGVALVSQIQREVMGGKSFEDVYKTRSDKLSLKRISVDELPTWIKEKIQVLKDGEISSIFTEDQFIMLQMQSRGPAYRKYDEVREEIRLKLQGRKGPFDLDAWLKEIRKDAVQIR